MYVFCFFGSTQLKDAAYVLDLANSHSLACLPSEAIVADHPIYRPALGNSDIGTHDAHGKVK